MNESPDILLTNDDGIYAPGLLALHQALQGLGGLEVIAPDTERSAAGHSITMLHILRVLEVERQGRPFGRAVNGTPADCVKLGLANLLPRPPRLIVSGINAGPNTGTNVLYSGTVSAAMEGAIYGVPSLAVSMGTLSSQHDYTTAAHFSRLVAERILARGLPPGIMLNLNVPTLPLEAIKGLRITRQAHYRYHDKYERRLDPRGREYFWLSLENVSVLDPSPDADAVAIAEGYVSLTPLSLDLTHRGFAQELAAWF
ncbi:MAG: 5'/3'-nucleotidase SurE [candidate division FCPU426 bacterium]